MTRKGKINNKIFYLLYVGLIALSIILVTTCLVLRFIGYVELNALFTVIKISLIVLVISIFFKTKL